MHHDGKKYRSLSDTLRLAAGSGRALVCEPLGGAAQLVDPDAVVLLGSCSRFDSIAGHARRVAAAHGVSPAVIEQRLSALVEAGLLRSEAELVAAARKAPQRDCQPPPLQRLGIATRGRPDTLVRTVESYVRNARHHGRDVRLSVCDDGHGDQARETGRAVAALTGRLGGQIDYLGPDQRAAAATALCERGGFDEALVRWALLGDEALHTTGAARNALCLHGVGEGLIFVDDDASCDLRAPGDRRTALGLTSQGDPAELWFEGAAGDWGAQLEPLDVDFVALHEELLGRDVGDCIHRAPGLDVAELSAGFARRLWRGAHVYTTQLGSYGDSGTGSLGHYLLLEGASRERLHRSEERYRRAWSSRQVARAVRQSSVTDQPLCMSMALGLDLSRLLAPFSPQLRNCDGVFGSTMAAAVSDFAAAFQPVMVLHEPPSPRRSSFDDFLTELRGVDGNDLLCRIIAAARPSVVPRDPACGLRALGMALRDVAAQRPRDFEAWVRQLVLIARAQEIQLLEQSLARHDFEPTWWAQDVRRACLELGEHLSRPSYCHPRDLARRYGREQASERFQDHVKRYGELLMAWPDMLIAARELHDRNAFGSHR